MHSVLLKICAKCHRLFSSLPSFEVHRFSGPGSRRVVRKSPGSSFPNIKNGSDHVTSLHHISNLKRRRHDHVIVKQRLDAQALPVNRCRSSPFQRRCHHGPRQQAPKTGNSYPVDGHQPVRRKLSTEVFSKSMKRRFLKLNRNFGDAFCHSLSVRI